MLCYSFLHHFINWAHRAITGKLESQRILLLGQVPRTKLSFPDLHPDPKWDTLLNKSHILIAYLCLLRFIGSWFLLPVYLKCGCFHQSQRMHLSWDSKSSNWEVAGGVGLWGLGWTGVSPNPPRTPHRTKLPPEGTTSNHLYLLDLCYQGLPTHSLPPGRLMWKTGNCFSLHKLQRAVCHSF